MTRTAIELDNHRLTQPTTAAEMPWGTWGYVADPRGRTVIYYDDRDALAPGTKVSPEMDLHAGGFQLHRDAEGVYHARFFRTVQTIDALTDPFGRPEVLELETVEAYGSGRSKCILVAEARRTGQLSLVVTGVAAVLWESARWRVAETLETIASAIDDLAQMAKP